METAYLTSEGFWTSADPLVLVNKRDPRARVQGELLRAWLPTQFELRGHLLFATSGSTGRGKWVALSREALLASAEAVNSHLDITSHDHWLLALPVFHVGGMGIMARAYRSGANVTEYVGDWDTSEFFDMLTESGATLTSLVPTQVVDLIELGKTAPSSLRAVLVGGGALSDDAYDRATALGWPILETYGMTETCSQVATADGGGREMKLLSGWQARTTSEGLLELRGPALLSAYVHCGDDGITIDSPVVDNWFTTRDRVSLHNHVLVFDGRSDRAVKILGELVDLDQIEKQLSDEKLYVVAVPDARRGHRVIACSSEDNDSVRSMLEQYNIQSSPVGRIDKLLVFPKLPTSSLGKIRYAELRDWVVEKTKSK